MVMAVAVSAVVPSKCPARCVSAAVRLSSRTTVHSSTTSGGRMVLGRPTQVHGPCSTSSCHSSNRRLRRRLRPQQSRRLWLTSLQSARYLRTPMTMSQQRSQPFRRERACGGCRLAGSTHVAGSRRGTHVLDGVCPGAILSRRLRNRRMHALNGNVDNGSKPLKVIEPTSTAGDGATTNSTASGATTEEHGMCLRPRHGEDRTQPEKRQSAAQATACDRRVQRQHIKATQQRRRAAEGAARHRESMHTDEPLGDGTEP